MRILYLKEPFFLSKYQHSSPVVPQSVSKDSILCEKNQVLKFISIIDQNQNAFYSSGQKVEVSGVAPFIGNSFGDDFLPSHSHLEQESLLNRTHFCKNFRFSECVFLVKYS